MGATAGSWEGPPARAERAWEALGEGFARIKARHPKSVPDRHPAAQLGTLGSGNHFIEVCLDGDDRVWFLLHSGSRGVGNRIGTYFIERAREEMQRQDVQLPDRDLAYLREGTKGFDDYVDAVGWAQSYALANRRVMMDAIVEAVGKAPRDPALQLTEEAVNCHHNYVARETHYGEEVLVTRKGAVRAGLGELGIIPGSMGARSYIVRGKGNPESFLSCSHGAGRVMSRNEAKKRFTVADHEKATAGVECRKDAGVIDETPGGLQAHRRRDGRPERPRGGRARAAAGGLRQRVALARKAPLRRPGSFPPRSSRSSVPFTLSCPAIRVGSPGNSRRSRSCPVRSLAMFGALHFSQGGQPLSNTTRHFPSAFAPPDRVEGRDALALRVEHRARAEARARPTRALPRCRASTRTGPGVPRRSASRSAATSAGPRWMPPDQKTASGDRNVWNAAKSRSAIVFAKASSVRQTSWRHSSRVAWGGRRAWAGSGPEPGEGTGRGEQAGENGSGQ